MSIEVPWFIFLSCIQNYQSIKSVSKRYSTHMLLEKNSVPELVCSPLTVSCSLSLHPQLIQFIQLPVVKNEENIQEEE